MKEVVFFKKTFLLTDLEFKEAVSCWDKKNNYYCERLESIIPEKFSFAGTPQKELGFKVYLYKSGNGGLGKIFVKNGNFYKEVGDENNSEKILTRVDDELKEKMVDQEKYYAMTKSGDALLLQ